MAKAHDHHVPPGHKGTQGHHDHGEHTRRLNRLVGQLQGVGRMLEDGRYCPDILTQTRAVIAGMRSLEDKILEGHLRHCVKSAFQAKSAAQIDEKIEELMEV